MRFEHLMLAMAAAAGVAGSVMANDNCATPTPLVAGVAATGNTTAATPSTGILAAHCGGTSETGRDEWYTFTATAAGNHTFSLCGSSYDTVLSLWTGCPDGALAPTNCNDDSCGLQSSITRTLAIGESVLVRVGGFSAAAGAYTLLASAPTPPPINNNCADALVTVVGASYTGSTSGASNDATGSCGGSATSADVWFSFQAPADGEYSFSTCDAVGYDTVLSFWDACGGTELLCDDDTDFGCSFSTLRSEIRRTMTGGESVLVRLAGFNGATGNYVLRVGDVTPPPPPPANDECVNALPISDGEAQVYTTTSATDSGVSTTCNATIYNDVFFTYNASCTGQVTIATCGTNYDTVLGVYGECGAPAVACDDDSCDGITPPGSVLASTLTFAASEGITYTIVVGGFSSIAEGDGTISISCVPDFVCPSADFNGDGFVDFFDYDDYVACFEGNCAPGFDADFNGDGFVDFFDYDDYVYAFEGCP